MKLPRNVDAARLIQSLRKLDYEVIRQSGSHIRLQTFRNGQHHETIPRHQPMKAGTLNSILRNIAQHHGMSRDEVLKLLDL